MSCIKLNNYYIKDIDKIIDDNIKLKTKGYGYLTVTERLSGGYCRVKFEDTGWVTNAKFDNILYGKVRDKMVFEYDKEKVIEHFKNMLKDLQSLSNGVLFEERLTMVTKILKSEMY